jgi:hypothetical protein
MPLLAVTVTLNGPATAVVPETCPAAERVMPLGSAPPVTRNVGAGTTVVESVTSAA